MNRHKGTTGWVEGFAMTSRWFAITDGILTMTNRTLVNGLPLRPGATCRRKIYSLCLIFPMIAIHLFLTMPALAHGQAQGTEYQPAPALIDLRTTFSDGDYDPEALVQMALRKGFGIIFLNDHDRMVMEYGLPPFRNIIRKRVEMNSSTSRGRTGISGRSEVSGRCTPT